jgi:hypothetical protein
MSNIHILNLSAYSSPTITESKGKDFVEYGEDNNYFQFLIDRFLYSNTNNAIITGVSNMIYGKGLDATDSNRKPNEYAQMKSIIKQGCLKKVALERKLLGMGAMQIGYDKGQVKFVEHFPMNTLRAEKCNDKGEIEAWYYHPNWDKYKKGDEIKRIPSFGFGNKKDVEIYVVKPYLSGYHYYTPIDYSGALPYAKLEEEIADYLINDVMNGFSGTKVINFNNNIPPEEKRQEVASDVKRKLTGSKGDKVIVSFNASAENKTTVDDIPLNDAPAHYEYLANQCFEKLIVGHRVTSPMLLGIRDTGGGLSNNSDEIETATRLFDNIVIRPYQIEIIEALDEILAVNSISLNLYFKTIQPLEFIDVNTANAEANEEATGVKMSSHVCCSKDKEDFDDDIMLDSLDGEQVSDEWELVDKREYSEENENVDSWAKRLIKEKKTGLQKFADFIKSKPSDNSFLDKSFYKIRYEYSEKYSSGNSRKFCKNMMSRSAKGVVYRKEDIDQASFQGVNNEFGHKGQNYSLFKYKGGVNCGHFWSENLYRLKTKTDGTFVEDKALSSSEEVNNIPNSYKPKGNEYTTSEIAPKDMPNNGHHPNYKN